MARAGYQYAVWLACCYAICANGQVTASEPVWTEHWLDTQLNGQSNTQTLLVLQAEDQSLWLSKDDLDSLQLSIDPKLQAYDYQGMAYYAISDLQLTYQLDEQQSALQLHAPIAHFKQQHYSALQPKHYQLTPSSLGSFINYDLSFNHSSADQQLQGSGLFELATFNRFGSVSNQFIAQYQPDAGQVKWTRLDSYFRKDDPEHMRSLRIGDSQSQGTSWSGGVRFAGVQWGSNFETRPDFVTLPLMQVAGEAALPSTVDLYMNNALRFQQQVSPGAFSIDDIPTISGIGEAKMVVRDILGREQIIRQNFFSHSNVLRQGLNEYQVELGRVRENYSKEDADYGRYLATATWRRGVLQNLTLETHAQWLEQQYMWGIGTHWLLPWNTFMSVAGAWSQTDQQHGQFAQLGLQHQGKSINFGLNSSIYSPEFVRLGLTESTQKISEQHQGYLGITGLGRGSLNLNYTRQQYQSGTLIDFISSNYSLPIFKRASLQLRALHFLHGGDSRLSVALSMPLGNRKHSSIRLSDSKQGLESQFQLQRDLPVGNGWGYQVRVTQSQDPQQELSVSYQNDQINTQFEATHAQDRLGLRANFKGGVVAMGGGVFASRALENSFAMVHLPDLPNVKIYAENQPVGKTNAKGYAFVPQLRPYERNQIGVQQADLPMDVKIKRLSMDVYPYYRSGVLLDFELERSHSAFFRLVDAQGQALPLGAVVYQNAEVQFPVGERGEVFIDEVTDQMRWSAQWQQQRCEFNLDMTKINTNSDELPNLVCIAAEEPTP